ncbi:hypothetical protein PIGHUM_01504 [Pigmentiphaga humi]|uniref:DUF4168 domain-containing protein n=1 Tax=Pigmentiphaga humi TaxID=2478468 RepID=A0A3P4B064_9BURK|nr:DUF4168 domain-containing protein [Pigmentiphaga humi]VCU69442.1 hypothetical protein PIGHUM_01504 [Pigmentiphaga humi]
MKTMQTLLIAGTLSAALAACAGPEREAPAEMTVSPQSVTSDQLQRFTNAARKVTAISQEYAPRTQGMRSDQATLLEQEANGRKAHAVWSEGLTVPEFNAINTAVQQDPALMRRYGELTWGGSAAPSGGAGYPPPPPPGGSMGGPGYSPPPAGGPGGMGQPGTMGGPGMRPR